MRRGSTPTHTFETDIDLREAEVYVTYSQGGKKLTKTGEDLDVTENSISVYLSQSDTLGFGVGHVEVQVRYKMPDGSADASDIVTIETERILLNGEI